MAQTCSGIRRVVVCTVFTGFWLAAGPAHAGVGDLADDALGGAGAVGNTVGDAVDDTVDTVGKVAGSADDTVKDTVRNVTKNAEPSTQEGSSGAGGGATEPSRAPAEPRRDGPKVVAAPQRAPVTPALDASPASPSDARALRGEAQRDQRSQERSRASAVSRGRRTSPPRDVAHRTDVAVRGAQEVAAPLALPADHPCASGSLAAHDLRQCARADLSLPGLGGVPMMLVPAGLVLIGLGLLLVARGRRRLATVGVAT